MYTITNVIARQVRKPYSSSIKTPVVEFTYAGAALDNLQAVATLSSVDAYDPTSVLSTVSFSIDKYIAPIDSLGCRVWLSASSDLFSADASPRVLFFSIWMIDGASDPYRLPVTFEIFDTVKVISVVNDLGDALDRVDGKYRVEYYPNFDTRLDGTTKVRIATISLGGGRAHTEAPYGVYLYENDADYETMPEGSAYTYESFVEDSHSEVILYYDGGETPISTRDKSVFKDVLVTVSDPYHSVTVTLTLVPVSNFEFSDVTFTKASSEKIGGTDLIVATPDQLSTDGVVIGTLSPSTYNFMPNRGFRVDEDGTVHAIAPITPSYTETKLFKVTFISYLENGRTFIKHDVVPDYAFYVIPSFEIESVVPSQSTVYSSDISSFFVSVTIRSSTGYGTFLATTFPENALGVPVSDVSPKVLTAGSVSENGHFAATITDAVLQVGDLLSNDTGVLQVAYLYDATEPVGHVLSDGILISDTDYAIGDLVYIHNSSSTETGVGRINGSTEVGPGRFRLTLDMITSTTVTLLAASTTLIRLGGSGEGVILKRITYTADVVSWTANDILHLLPRRQEDLPDRYDRDVTIRLAPVSKSSGSRTFVVDNFSLDRELTVPSALHTSHAVFNLTFTITNAGFAQTSSVQVTVLRRLYGIQQAWNAYDSSLRLFGTTTPVFYFQSSSAVGDVLVPLEQFVRGGRNVSVSISGNTAPGVGFDATKGLVKVSNVYTSGQLTLNVTDSGVTTPYTESLLVNIRWINPFSASLRKSSFTVREGITGVSDDNIVYYTSESGSYEFPVNLQVSGNDSVFLVFSRALLGTDNWEEFADEHFTLSWVEHTSLVLSSSDYRFDPAYKYQIEYSAVPLPLFDGLLSSEGKLVSPSTRTVITLDEDVLFNSNEFAIISNGITVPTNKVAVNYDPVTDGDVTTYANYAPHSDASGRFDGLPVYQVLLARTAEQPLVKLYSASVPVTRSTNPNDYFLLTIVDTTQADGVFIDANSTIPLDATTFTSPNASGHVNAPQFRFNGAFAGKSLYFNNDLKAITFADSECTVVSSVSDTLTLQQITAVGVPSQPEVTDSAQSYALVIVYVMYDPSTRQHIGVSKSAYRLGVLNVELVDQVRIAKSSVLSTTGPDCLRLALADLSFNKVLGDVSSVQLLYSLRAGVESDYPVQASINDRRVVTFSGEWASALTSYIARAGSATLVFHGELVTVTTAYTVDLAPQVTTAQWRVELWYEVAANTRTTPATKSDLEFIVNRQGDEGYGYPERFVTRDILPTDPKYAYANTTTWLRYALWVQTFPAYAPDSVSLGFVQSNVFSVSSGGQRDSRTGAQFRDVGISPVHGRYTTKDDGSLANGLQSGSYLSADRVFDASGSLLRTLPTSVDLLCFNL